MIDVDVAPRELREPENATARAVRLVMTTFMLISLTILATLTGFTGDANGGAGLDAPRTSDAPALAAAVQVQQSRGLTCDATPRFTDTVLFERWETGAIEVLTFRQAVSATAAGWGTARSYCI